MDLMTNMPLERIKELQDEMRDLLSDIRSVYTGLYYPVNTIIMENDCQLSVEAVTKVVDELMLYTECPEEMNDFYRELYIASFLYLYTVQLNADDMILLSVWKIAATFTHDMTRSYFENTPFGIMLSDIWSGREDVETHVTGDGQPFVVVLRRHAERLEKLYNDIKECFSAGDIIRSALEIYTVRHGLSAFCSEGSYNIAVSSLRSALWDARYEMRNRE